MARVVMQLLAGVVLCGVMVFFQPGVIPACEYFSEVLHNTSTRKSFLAHFNYAKSLPVVPYGALKKQNDHLFVPYVIQGRTFSIDKQTKQCLSCHDDMISAGKDADGRSIIEKNYHETTGKHAIGLNYFDFVINYPQTFLYPDPARHNIIFVGGKLGCLSCHNPFSPLPFHLNALESDGSLCNECHRR